MPIFFGHPRFGVLEHVPNLLAAQKLTASPFRMHAHKHAVDDQECLERMVLVFQESENKSLKPIFAAVSGVAQSHADIQ